MLIVQQQKRRRPSLTPLIDVVFLLLIFFMIVSRLSIEQQTPLSLAASGSNTAATPIEAKAVQITLDAQGYIKSGTDSYTFDAFKAAGIAQKDQAITVALAEGVTFQQTLILLEKLRLSGFSNVKLSIGGVEG